MSQLQPLARALTTGYAEARAPLVPSVPIDVKKLQHGVR